MMHGTINSATNHGNRNTVRLDGTRVPLVAKGGGMHVARGLRGGYPSR